MGLPVSQMDMALVLMSFSTLPLDVMVNDMQVCDAGVLRILFEAVVRVRRSVYVLINELRKCTCGACAGTLVVA